MRELDLKMVEVGDADRQLISSFVAEHWGSPFSVSRGRMHDTPDLPGFICKVKDEIVGLVTYHIENEECEIVTLDSSLGQRIFLSSMR